MQMDMISNVKTKVFIFFFSEDEVHVFITSDHQINMYLRINILGIWQDMLNLNKIGQLYYEEYQMHNLKHVLWSNI